MFKPYPVLIAFVFALLGILINGIFPALVLTHSLSVYLSAVFCAFGVFLICWSIHFFKILKTAIMPFETPNKFIKQGPFRYSRNPIYLGMLLILSGAFLFLGNTLNLLLLVLFVYVMNKLIIINEEKVLEREFGSDYRNYKSSVKRWIL